MTADLGPSGKAIWAGFSADKLDAASQALVRELARCADTLDKLDGLAVGRQEAWAVLVFDEMGEIHLTIDKILDVRRNHQLALKALYAEIRAAGIKAASAPAAWVVEEEDLLTKRRREKAERERQSG